ncbi:hypothetical protein [Marinigracilibium pacificum]|uniref:Uncharacterized protein n=1 Tax=Marinigracilibium pacificum TaxID=2729599 RepID=A0A848J0D7_9BACT|nr:hypothetical protein [Marinigracilibium pacificum]NMM50017.1 hypothetical protein [Marinigracilibium pacificum]
MIASNTYEIRWFFDYEVQKVDFEQLFNDAEFVEESRVDNYLISNNNQVSIKRREGLFEFKYSTNQQLIINNFVFQSYRKYSFTNVEEYGDNRFIDVHKKRIVYLLNSGNLRIENSSLQIGLNKYHSVNIEINETNLEPSIGLLEQDSRFTVLFSKLKSISDTRIISYSEFISQFY